MNGYVIAFVLGLSGSVHCIGMCGPLAFSIPSLHINGWMVVFDRIIYNVGRIITYTFLGLLIGLIGKQLWMAGLQQALSLGTGFMIVLAGLSRIIKKEVFKRTAISGFLSPINSIIGYALKHRWGHLAVGILNGFLPCGFVYIALAGALNTVSPFSAAAFMGWFGIGTLPLMVMATLGAGLMKPAFRSQINSFMPYLMVFLGIWFILRGMELDIPYLSPAKPAFGLTICR